MNDDKWNTRYMNIAKEVSSWSQDPSTKVGSVIVGTQGQIISQGYNGFPRGVADGKGRYHDRSVKYKLIVHAEANAIYNAIHSGASTVGSTIYVHGLHICHECAKAIIQTGISKIVLDSKPLDDPRWKESAEYSLMMLKEANVEVTYL